MNQWPVENSKKICTLFLLYLKFQLAVHMHRFAVISKAFPLRAGHVEHIYSNLVIGRKRLRISKLISAQSFLA